MAVFFLQIPAAAQAPVLEGEMKELEFLVGEWKGEGWETFPGRSYKNSFKQKTKIDITKDGLLRKSLVSTNRCDVDSVLVVAPNSAAHKVRLRTDLYVHHVS